MSIAAWALVISSIDSTLTVLVLVLLLRHLRKIRNGVDSLNGKSSSVQ